MFVEFENVPFYCLESEISTPTARGGQTLVRLKMRNMLTRAVFDKTFKASDKFKEPDLQTVEASYSLQRRDGSYFLDQETFENADAQRADGRRCTQASGRRLIIHIDKYNGNPSGCNSPPRGIGRHLYRAGVRGDTRSGNVTKPANWKPA